MRDDTWTPQRNALYQAQFELLSSNTTEHRDMLAFFAAEILPRLPAMGHLLDIGAGRGNYARPLALVFEQTSVVEPNEVFYAELLEWAGSAGCNLRGYPESWQDLSWKGGKTDLVLMSHMLYYVPKEQRLDFIRRAYATLKAGGTLLIVLNSERCGIRDVYKEFYTDDLYEEMPYGEEIAALLRAAGHADVQERVFPALITLSSREEFEQMIDFLLMRRVPFDGDEAALARREAFIEAHRRADGKYHLDSEGVIVVLRKE